MTTSPAPQVNLIAAIGRRWQIGLSNGLPWQDKDDLAWFREQTMGGFLIAGAATYDHLPNLDGRLVFRDGDLSARETVRLVSKHFPSRPLWIIGGTKTWIKYAPLVTQMYLSSIDYDGPADRFFPHEAFPASLILNATRRLSTG